MRKILSICVLLSLTTLLACEGRSVEGTYYNVANPKEYLELKGGSKYYLESDNKAVSGNYSVDGKTLILNPGTKMSAQGRIEKDIITDGDGTKWKKK